MSTIKFMHFKGNNPELPLFLGTKIVHVNCDKIFGFGQIQTW